jgi:hypothetical protein
MYDQSMSPLALWSARLAFFAAAVAVLSIIIVRSGILEIGPAVATFGAALAFAAAAILLAFASFVAIWINGAPGLGRAFLGLFLGLALLAYPAYIAYSARHLPHINDVTTDLNNPPRFDVLARLRPRDRIDYPTFFAEAQRQSYPDILPLRVALPVRPAYDAAMKVIANRKWLVVDARPPTAPGRPGVIEAVARTPVMGFREDVVVRVTPEQNGSRIDVGGGGGGGRPARRRGGLRSRRRSSDTILVATIAWIGTLLARTLRAFAALAFLALLVIIASVVAIMIPIVSRGYSCLAAIIAPVVLRSGHTSHERRDGEREHD